MPSKYNMILYCTVFVFHLSWYTSFNDIPSCLPNQTCIYSHIIVEVHVNNRLRVWQNLTDLLTSISVSQVTPLHQQYNITRILLFDLISTYNKTPLSMPIWYVTSKCISHWNLYKRGVGILKRVNGLY